MKTIPYLIVIFITCIFANELNGCATCIEAPINGSECVACAPDGWSIYENTPDICNGGATWTIFCDLDSYDGGGIAAIGAAPGYFESIIYTFDDLVVNATYYIGFEAYKCIGDGTLEVTIGDEEYSYTLGDEWEQLIYCFVAESDEIDIIFESTAESSVTFNMVDYLPCSYVETLDSECAGTVAVDIEEDEMTVCPGEEFIVTTTIDPYTGSEIIFWESDPPEGLDYLDDSDPLEPVFLLPDNGDFEGEVFTFFINVDDGTCTGIDEIEITVTPSLTPEFDDLILCANGTPDDLPVESEDGFLGFWDGPTPFEDYQDEVVTFTFFIDPNQDNCLESAEYDIYIENIDIAEFSFPLVYCSNDSSLIIFPELSDNLLIGEWSEGDFIPHELPIGFTNFVFTPDEDDHPCNLPLSIEIEIIPDQVLSFGIPDNFCAGDTFSFPPFSAEEIRGEWMYANLDSFQIAGSYENVFLPFNTDCGESYVHRFEVIDLNVPPIVTDPSLCDSSDGKIEFDSMLDLEYSIDMGVTWQTEGGFLDLEAGLYQVIYRYNEGGICPDTLELTLNGGDSPSISDIVISDDTDCLSDNGEAIIIGGTTGEYEYSIDGGLTWQEEDRFNELPEGQYSLLVRYITDPSCTSEYPFVIDGVLSPMIENILTDDITDCNIEDGVIQILATGDNLEYSIDGGVTFSLSNVFEDLSTGTYQIVVQGVGQNCDVSGEATIIGPELPEADIVSQSPTSCVVNDGVISFDSDRLGELEFSIDGGLSWQAEADFTELGAGGYSIMYRLINSPGCEASLSAQLISPDLPEVEDILITDNSNCSSPNGEINIVISQNDVEYSIDGGTSWSSNTVFANLEGGTYEVQVRVITNPDCVYSQIVNLEDYELPVINDITVLAVSDCGADDGTIAIEALGSNLQYSIDNGSIWQSSNIFENLSPDDYLVSVSVEGGTDCIVSQTVTIGGLTPPDLNALVLNDASACVTNNGEVLLESDFIPVTDIEFSIDGMMWQDDGNFDDLISGNYSAYVRLKDSPSCLNQTPFSIQIEPEELTGISIVSLDPSDCDIDDGQIEISNSNSLLNLEYSIDNTNWRSDNIFSNLVEGTYICYIRLVDSPLCTYEQTVELVSPDCPCSDYELSATSDPVLCELELGSILVDLKQDENIVWDDGSTDYLQIDLNSGWYSFTIIYQDGLCSHRDSVFVDEIDRIEFLLESFPSDCEGDDNGFVEIVDITGGDGNYNFSLDGMVYQGQSGFYDLSPGQYEMYITDETGCQSNEQFVIHLGAEEIDVILPESLSIAEGETITLNPLINGETIDSFIWSPADYIIDPSELIVEAQPLEDITYTLTVYYGDGCVHTRTISVDVSSRPEELYIPNVIDLRDTRNSVFFISARSDFRGTINSMAIYDRWGNKVFFKENPEINNPDNGWNPSGEYRVIQGVYVYLVEYETNSKLKQSIGSVTVIR